MRRVLVRSLLVIGIGGLALAGVLYVASTVDARPPEVLSIAVTQPVGGDPELALITTSIEVAFNEPVETDAAAAIRLEPPVEGTASWSGTALTFTPADPLELSTGYEVHVEPGIRDLAGNEMTEAPPAFAFETAGRPRIAATDPEDGAETVPIELTVAITFSSLMDTAVVEEQLRLEPGFSHDLRWAGELLEIVPAEPLRPDTQYEISIGADATDAAGVAIGETLRFAFTTVEPGLQVERIVPAHQVDGIAPTTAVAVIFDRPIDADSVDGDAFSLTPAVAGSLEVTAVPGEEGDGEGAGRMLRFVPSGPLPANTTFEVEVAPEIVPAAGGGGMAEGLSWTFTTGAPSAAISNQITFLTDRAGVSNVWAMNADGTGQHQVSAELAPVLDYAVAPDGSSLVVADGRRLVFLRPDGSDRRVITGGSHLEFDPTYAPDARIVAFGRADAETGSGLGLWQWEVGGSDPEPIDIPGDLGATPQPSPVDGEPAPMLRAPRFAPDGLALAFVDASGSVGVIELPGQRLTRVAFGATGPPSWMPDSSAVLLTGQRDGVDPTPAPSAPIGPLEPGDDDAVFRLARSGTTPSETALMAGWRVVAVATDGMLAYATDRGRLGVTTRLDEVGDEGVVSNARVTDAAFAPGNDAMVIVVAGAEGDPGTLELLDLGTGRRSPLAPEGWLPLWLP
jgi:hypothetical protein